MTELYYAFEKEVMDLLIVLHEVFQILKHIYIDVCERKVRSLRTIFVTQLFLIHQLKDSEFEFIVLF